VRTAFVVESVDDAPRVAYRRPLDPLAVDAFGWDKMREAATNFGLRLARLAAQESRDSDTRALLRESGLIPDESKGHGQLQVSRSGGAITA
jgi:hypothetical protein